MPARRKLKDLAMDPRFIPGVYNYCERCPLTTSSGISTKSR